MKTAILVYGPEFACTENLTRAFGMLGDVQLISAQDGDGGNWREYDAGIIIDNDKRLERARAIADEADLLIVGGAVSFACLGRVGGQDWVRWARKKRVACFFGDSAYFKHAAYYEGMCKAIGTKRIFLLPDLIPLAGMEAIPFHHPTPLLPSEKGETLTVMHSPGRDGKAVAKGTATIEEAVRDLQGNGLEFEYKRLMHLPLKECWREKGAAHIFIDQLPPPGWPRGLGRSGMEGLAVGAVTMSDMYPAKNVEGFFRPAPVVRVRSQGELTYKLRRLLVNEDLRKRLQKSAREWILEIVDFEPWLRYVERWL